MLQGTGNYNAKRQCGWRIRCASEPIFLQLLRSKSVDGAITAFSTSDDPILKQVVAAGVPCASAIFNCYPRFPSVVSDEHAIGRTAAQYFMGRGFTNFAYLGFKSDWSIGRQQGFKDTIVEAGHRCHTWSPGKTFLFLETPDAVRKVQRWLANLPKPLALLVCADYIGPTTIEICQSAGMRVPEDVAILGVGNHVATCELAPVPLSSIVVDFAGMAFEAARLLDRLISTGKRPDGPLQLPPGVVVSRRSTAAFQFDDRYVAAALQVIHDHAAVGITIKELLRKVPVSRQWLDTRFKAIVGHTASHEIRTLRLERVRDLLLNSNLSIQQIAVRCGFSRPENLTRFFRDNHGVAPETFRRQNIDRKI